MGGIAISPNSLASFLGERIGFKSGLALTREEIAEHLSKNSPLRAPILKYCDAPIKVGSSDITDAFQLILYRLGVLDRPFVGDAITQFDFKYIDDKKMSNLLEGVLKLLGDFHFNKGNSVLGVNFDKSTFFGLVNVALPEGSLALAKDLIEYMELGERASPWEWCEARSTNWSDRKALQDLFGSQSLESAQGTFLDQRFIDYLAMNFEKIDDINWRKFEGLTAEYFHRCGFRVEIGSGRNDGGVDIRVWNPTDIDGIAPLLLIQCKRQRRKIEKAVVKSIWADLIQEKAEAAMIVTTSSLSPGAQTVRSSRNYPIFVADKQNVKNWIYQLRKPERGIFLGS